MAFIMLRYVPSIATFWIGFVINRYVEFFQKVFINLLRWSHDFYSSICWNFLVVVQLFGLGTFTAVIWVWFLVRELGSCKSWSAAKKEKKKMLLCITLIEFSLLVFGLHLCSSVIRSVAQSCPTLCDPMNHSTPGLPVHHQLLEFTQTHAHRVSDAIQPSHPLLSPLSSCPQSLPASESFPMSQLFAWGGQSTGVSA